MESRRMDAAREATPAVNPAQARESKESADMETAATGRAAPAPSGAAREDDDAAQDGDEGTATALSQPHAAADTPNSASRNRNDEEASLLVPKRGMPAPL